MGGTPGAPPPLGHCPRDVINLKNAPTLGHSQAPPPPLDIARVTSSTYSKGGTKLLKGGTKLLKGGTKLLKGGTKLLKDGTKSLGWATGGGGVVRPPDPPPPLATGLHTCAQTATKLGHVFFFKLKAKRFEFICLPFKAQKQSQAIGVQQFIRQF